VPTNVLTVYTIIALVRTLHKLQLHTYTALQTNLHFKAIYHAHGAQLTQGEVKHYQ